MKYQDVSPKTILKIWKKSFPDASILVNVENNITITHTLTNNKLEIPTGTVKLNGIAWDHPLIINALYGWQVSDDVLANWYEIILTEIPGVNGSISAVQAFRKILHKYNIDTSADHYHWKGGEVAAFALHISSYSSDQITFSKSIIKALAYYGHIARKNGAKYSHKHNSKKMKECDKYETKDARKILKLWQTDFPDAVQLLDIPNKILFTHTYNDNTIGIASGPMNLNNTDWTHPLVLNALHGYQTNHGVTANWYETTIMEVPGYGEYPSAGEVYIRALESEGLYVEGDHYHWKGDAHAMFAVHHSSYDKSPKEFVKSTLRALEAYSKAVKKNMKY